MDNKTREPFDPNKNDYKSIMEIEELIDNTKLSDEKVESLIESFKSSENLLDYPSIDDFCEQEEKGKSK